MTEQSRTLSWHLIVRLTFVIAISNDVGYSGELRNALIEQHTGQKAKRIARAAACQFDECTLLGPADRHVGRMRRSAAV